MYGSGSVTHCCVYDRPVKSPCHRFPEHVPGFPGLLDEDAVNQMGNDNPVIGSQQQLDVLFEQVLLII